MVQWERSKSSESAMNACYISIMVNSSLFIDLITWQYYWIFVYRNGRFSRVWKLFFHDDDPDPVQSPGATLFEREPFKRLD